MITRASRPILFIYVSVMSFLLLMLTLYSYFYAAKKQEWLLELFRVKLFHLPLILYILLFSLTIGMLVVANIYFIHRCQYNQVEESIRLLAQGNYESPILEKTSLRAKHDHSSDIHQGLTSIREKLVTMSKELQILNSKPELVEGESKEEILEQERHRLARELHDSVSQQLFAAMMMLSALNEQAEKKNVPAEFYHQLQMVENMINASQSEMRALLLHLRPVNLEGKSLRKGIEQLLIELQTKIQINLLWEVEDVHLQSGMEDHLFRIVQELLSNTLRHAHAKELEVYLKKVKQSVLLRMVDDGIGFATEDVNVGSYGLNNIRERVTGMGGTSKIISFKGKGTSVEIKVPILGSEE